MTSRVFVIRQITSDSQLAPYRASLGELLDLYRHTLLPNAMHLGREKSLALLVENTASCIPLLWLITDRHQQVYGASVLMDVIPKQHAYVHGVTHPVIRRHPVITQLAITMFQMAFTAYGVSAIKAEFGRDNQGALGFCRRMRFQRNGGTHVLTQERFSTLIDNPVNTQPYQKESCHAHWK